MKYWLCITDDANWKIVKTEKIWGVSDRHKDRIARTNEGDNFVFYVKPMRIGGIFEVISKPFREETPIFEGGIYPNRVKIKAILLSKRFLEFRPLIDKLQFITRKKMWGGYLQGKAMKPIPNEDFELIKEKLEPLKVEEIKNQKEKHFSRKEKVFGQFMTPPEVANFIVDFATLSLDREPKLAIDPACGDGVFLEALIKKKIHRVVGIDIDEKIIPDTLKNKCEMFAPRNGLSPLDKTLEGHADIVVGNPPFSAKYGRVKKKEIQSRFELGKKTKSQAIEILFLEKFLQLASESGVVGIILPSGIFSNLPLVYVQKFILENTSICGIISLPRGIFKKTKNTTSKTSVLIARKEKSENDNVFMGIVNKLGDLPLILRSHQSGEESVEPPAFWANPKVALYPEYHLLAKHVPKKGEKLGNLISEMFGGKTEYGPRRRFVTNGIRFISAKTVTPLGIDFTKENRGRHYVDPKSNMYRPKAHVRVGDLLFVRVGVGCMGRAAVVTDPSEQGVADDWIYVIRPRNEQMVYYLAFYLQSRYGRLQLERMKRGVGTVTVPQNLLKSLSVLVPPKRELRISERMYHQMVELRKKGAAEEAEKVFTKAVEWIDGGANRWGG